MTSFGPNEVPLVILLMEHEGEGTTMSCEKFQISAETLSESKSGDILGFVFRGS
jgi:hypothetical protein